ncbi:MAG: NAD(P)-binding domain-containing protein [Planctomycetota bacterium]
MTWLSRYAHWLHLQWPGGTVEKLPIAGPDGSTNVPGLSIVGDLTGVPLLKLSANAGYDAACRVAGELEGETSEDGVLDVAIIGGGTAGFSAAVAAREKGLRYCVFEGSSPFNTIKGFPKGKPIFTYPTETRVKAFDLHEKSNIKEGLVEDLEEQTVDTGLKWVTARVEQVNRKGGLFHVKLAKPAQTPDGVHLNGTGFVTDGEVVKAKRVIVGIGRSGNYRKLGVPGEGKSDKVSYRLHDPKDYCGKKTLIVGGGDSAMEAAIALTKCGGDVTLSYRKPEFSRAKPENQETLLRLAKNPAAEATVEPSDHRTVSAHGDFNKDDANPDAAKGTLSLMLPSNVKEIRDDTVVLDQDGETKEIENDQVFLMLGREAPLDFFRRSGVKIRGERSFTWWWTLIAFLFFCIWMYHWKGAGNPGKPLLGIDGLYMPSWLQLEPADGVAWLRSVLSGYFSDVTTFGGTVLESMKGRSFYYSFAYCACVVIFGIDRMRRRRTPYIKVQTITLMLFQCIPLFFLPEILLPYMGRNGWFAEGAALHWIGETLFPGESYWRAYGLILAWPLMAWNWFTHEPILGWVVLGFFQTFVLIPGMIYFWGKGAYCGWICSCGALAETLGDRHREKMPHGKGWNKVNFVGQVLLAFGLVLQGLFILRWTGVEWAAEWSDYLAGGIPLLSWAYFVDLLWAGIAGVALYFWFSGRVWCRFACPLAALMHIYHRFSRYAIIPEKKKCISCNVCTSVCHQGIDIMSFANKGRPMVDPECVRCSACLQMCPTGVLEFGQIDREGKPTKRDPSWLAASPVRIRENSLGGGVDNAEASQRAPAPVRAKLTINGKRARKTTDPSILSTLVGRCFPSS